MAIKTRCRAVFVGSILTISTVLLFSCEADEESPGGPAIVQPKPVPPEQLPGEKTYDEFGGQSADRVFTISGAEDWTDALTAISEGADDGEANYFIDITENVSVPGSTAPTFGDRTDIAVIIWGDDTTLKLAGTGNLIKMAEGQTVSVRDSVTLEGNASNNTSLVSIPAGVFEMSDTVKITGNKAGNTAGGGVRVTGSGALTMKGQSSVTGNFATGSSNGDGGGVSLNGGSITMTEDASISGNTAEDDGGGVYMLAGTFKMGGRAKITGNITKNNSNSLANGGGMFISAGLFVMKDEAEISGNTAWGERGRAGGGIQTYTNNAVFRFGGGTITGCDASHAATAHNPENPEDRDSCNINWTGTAVSAVNGPALANGTNAAQYGLLDEETDEFTEGGTDLVTTSNTIYVINGELQQ